MPFILDIGYLIRKYVFQKYRDISDFSETYFIIILNLFLNCLKIH